MKSSVIKYTILLIICGSLAFNQSCKKDKEVFKFKYGIFPTDIINLSDLNSEFDDYNTDAKVLQGQISIVFSSSRKSGGGQFDLEQGAIPFTYDRMTGEFQYSMSMTNDSFTQSLIDKVVTPRDDFGPHRFFCTIDGFEYLILSSENTSGDLDFYYIKNLPTLGSNTPEIQGPYPINLLNTASNDAYISFNQNFSSAYFSSDRGGNFDIYTHNFLTESDKTLSDQLDMSYVASVKVDSVNSSEDDKCPFIHKNVMVFASNRLGGLGGYDLYYSILKDGKWCAPINFGPTINTPDDEYRPILGTATDFKNSYMIFSSNRPGGKGGFDLYFKGIYLSEL